MEKEPTRNRTAEETNLLCSIISDMVNKFILTLDRKALKKLLLELKNNFMDELLRTFFIIKHLRWLLMKNLPKLQMARRWKSQLTWT